MTLKTTLISSLVFASLLVTPVAAQTASPSGTLRDSVKQKVAEELAQIKKAVAKKGFVGSITSKTDATVTISTLKNESRTLTLTTETTIKLQNGKDGSIADLKTNDFVLAMGDVDSQNAMTAKRLLVIATPPTDNRVTYFGTITKSSSSTFTISTPKNETFEIKATAGTKYNDKYKFSDLKDQKVVVIASSATISGKTTLTALRVHLLP